MAGVRVGEPGYKTLRTTFRVNDTGASYGRPVPIVFGTARVNGTIIQSGSYNLYRTGMGYTVPATMSQVALCEGPISEVYAVWKEQTKTTPGALGLHIATGTLPQSPWPWMTANWPQLALGYGGVAVASAESGHAAVATGELERTSYWVRGMIGTEQDGAATAYDSRVWDIVWNLLGSPRFGLGIPDSVLGDWNAGAPFQVGADGTTASGFARYCDANEFHVSLVLSVQQPTTEILDELLTATDSVALWSEGVLKLRPMGEETVVGTVTYTPSMTPSYDLGYSAPGSDFLADPGDPAVTLERAPRADTYNCFPVEFSNRFPARKDTTGATISEPFNAYNADLEDGVPDPVDVEKVGLRKASPTVLRCITRAAHARRISELLVRRALYTERNTYKFRLGWRFALLEPTDLVTITDATLGLSRQLVRITEIEEQEDGSFDVRAMEVGTVSVAAAATYVVT